VFSSSLSSANNWSNPRLICFVNLALYAALALSRSSWVCRVDQQLSFLQMKQRLDFGWLVWLVWLR
jgi:hypothetical protein